MIIPPNRVSMDWLHYQKGHFISWHVNCLSRIGTSWFRSRVSNLVVEKNQFLNISLKWGSERIRRHGQNSDYVQDETDTQSRSRGMVCREVSMKSGGLGSGILGATKAVPAQGGFAWDQIKTKMTVLGRISLVVQWLRICLQCRGHGSIPAPGRFHRPRRD